MPATIHPNVPMSRTYQNTPSRVVEVAKADHVAQRERDLATDGVTEQRQEERADHDGGSAAVPSCLSHHHAATPMSSAISSVRRRNYPLDREPAIGEQSDHKGRDECADREGHVDVARLDRREPEPAPGGGVCK